MRKLRKLCFPLITATILYSCLNRRTDAIHSTVPLEVSIDGARDTYPFEFFETLQVSDAFIRHFPEGTDFRRVCLQAATQSGPFITAYDGILYLRFEPCPKVGSMPKYNWKFGFIRPANRDEVVEIFYHALGASPYIGRFTQRDGEPLMLIDMCTNQYQSKCIVDVDQGVINNFAMIRDSALLWEWTD